MSEDSTQEIRRAEDERTCLWTRFFDFRNMKKGEINQQKKDYVAGLADEMKSASSVVLIDYTGLGVKAQQSLKKLLKETGGKMIVVKNTLIKLAAKKADIPEGTLEGGVLTGQTALVFSKEDPLSPIQVLGKFREQNEVLEFKAGVVDGQFYEKEGLMKISKLPSREVLLGQVVSGIASPLYGLIGTLEGNLQKLVWVLKAKAEA